MSRGGDGGGKSDMNANDTLEPLLDKGDHSIDLTPPEDVRAASQSGDDRVYFNVGGVVFQTLEATIKHLRNKKFKLTDPDFLSRYYDYGRREYFFDRDPEVFRSVLNYWRTGRLHLPASMCGPQLKEELDFWGLREVDIEPCCWNSFNQSMQTVTSLKQLEIDRNPSYMHPTEEMSDTTNTSRLCHVARLHLWNLLTDPSYSKAAKIYAYVSLVFVLLAIFSFCASTHKLFDISDGSSNLTNSGSENSQAININISANHSELYQKPTTTSTPNINLQKHWQDSFSSRIHPALFFIDIICLVFFTVEYLVKFICASPRCQFVTSITAVIDLLAILPDYLELLLYLFAPELLVKENTGIIDFMPFLRLMRAFRIFRLIRRVPGLWIMMYTLRASFKELSLMLVFLLVGTLLFASIIFFVDDPKIFTSIPHGFWWAIVTMTTVGYGDMAPVTAWGQIVGSVTAICGVLIVGFTIPSLVNNFITYYNHIEFVVQKERLLKILAEEEQEEGEDTGEGEERLSERCGTAQKQSVGPNGNRSEFNDNGFRSRDSAGLAQSAMGRRCCVDEERGRAGGAAEGENGRGEEAARLVPSRESSSGIALVSLKSL